MSTSFAKATVSESVSGELVADISCLNGAVHTEQLDLPSSATYFDGSAISEGEEVLFTLTSNNQINESYIFPYNEETGNPLSVGGGIGKGTIIEDIESTTGTGGTGTGSGNPPINAAVSVHWVNGLVADGVISEVSDESALSINIGTEVYFLMTYNGNSIAEVQTVTVCDSTCGDVPAGESQFTFGEGSTSLAQTS